MLCIKKDACYTDINITITIWLSLQTLNTYTHKFPFSVQIGFISIH